MNSKKIKEIMNVIKEKRTLLGLTQMYFAEKLNVSYATYSNLESGKTEITLSKLLELIEILKQESLLINKNSNDTFAEISQISKEFEFLK